MWRILNFQNVSSVAIEDAFGIKTRKTLITIWPTLNFLKLLEIITKNDQKKIRIIGFCKYIISLLIAKS